PRRPAHFSGAPMRAKSWTVAIALVAAAFAASALPARAAEADPLAAAPPELRDAVGQLLNAVPHWQPYQIDREPTVPVADQRGYRVVLRRSWMDYPEGYQHPQQIDLSTEKDRTVPK